MSGILIACDGLLRTCTESEFLPAHTNAQLYDDNTAQQLTQEEILQLKASQTGDQFSQYNMGIYVLANGTCQSRCIHICMYPSSLSS